MKNLLFNLASSNPYGGYERYSESDEAALFALGIFFIGAAIIGFIAYLITSISLFILLSRADHVRPWSAFIPIWNTIALFELGGIRKAWLWTLILIVPSAIFSAIPIIGVVISLAIAVISIILTVYTAKGIQAGFGRGGVFGIIASVLFTPFWLLWLAIVTKDFSLEKMRASQDFFFNENMGRDNYRIFANEVQGAPVHPGYNQGYQQSYNPQVPNSYDQNAYGGYPQQPQQNYDGYQTPVQAPSNDGFSQYPSTPPQAVNQEPAPFYQPPFEDYSETQPPKIEDPFNSGNTNSSQEQEATPNFQQPEFPQSPTVEASNNEDYDKPKLQDPFSLNKDKDEDSTPPEENRNPYTN